MEVGIRGKIIYIAFICPNILTVGCHHQIPQGKDQNSYSQGTYVR